MNRLEALKILGLDESASKDEIKKRFRELSKEKHPDKNKEPGAEEEYKKLSAAYTYLQNPPPEPQQFRPWPGQGQGFGFTGGGGFGHVNIDDFFPRRTRSIYKPEPIKVSISLSFNESVLGCKKRIVFDRTGPCPSCKGLGYEPCTSCGGIGFTQTIRVQGNMTFTNRMGCTMCGTKGHTGTECPDCNGKKTKEEHIDVEVNVPGGVHNGQVIRLQRAGNAVADEYGMAQGDVLINAHVESDPDMRIVGRDVISNVEISLCEALKGAKKKVRTVKGKMTMKVSKGAKHRDQVKLSGYGVAGVGNHIFTLEVKYPKETDKLIEFLENNKEE